MSSVLTCHSFFFKKEREKLENKEKKLKQMEKSFQGKRLKMLFIKKKPLGKEKSFEQECLHGSLHILDFHYFNSFSKAALKGYDVSCHKFWECLIVVRNV